MKTFKFSVKFSGLNPVLVSVVVMMRLQFDVCSAVPSVTHQDHPPGVIKVAKQEMSDTGNVCLHWPGIN